LEKSRAELRSQGIYEQEILKQAIAGAATVRLVLATVFFLAQLVTGGGIHWGIWFLAFRAHMTTFRVKYRRLRRRHGLLMAIVYKALVLLLSTCHLYSLLPPSAVL
jgi:hypothetical protein